MSAEKQFVPLLCGYCGNAILFPRRNDSIIPQVVALLEVNGCEICEAAEGGFGEEIWYDANGEMVEPLMEPTP